MRLPEWQKRSTEQKNKGLQLAMAVKSNGHTLMSDIEHRDPVDDLHNIDDGKMLQALSELPQYIRQLQEDGSMRIEIEEVNGHWRFSTMPRSSRQGM